MSKTTTSAAKRRESWEWRHVPKLFHDFNEPLDDEGRYRVVIPKQIVVGESELEIDGIVEEIDDRNELCFVLHVRPVGEYRDFENGLWIEREGADPGGR